MRLPRIAVLATSVVLVHATRVRAQSPMDAPYVRLVNRHLDALFNDSMVRRRTGAAEPIGLMSYAPLAANLGRLPESALLAFADLMERSFVQLSEGSCAALAMANERSANPQLNISRNFLMPFSPERFRTCYRNKKVYPVAPVGPNAKGRNLKNRIR